MRCNKQRFCFNFSCDQPIFELNIFDDILITKKCSSIFAVIYLRNNGSLFIFFATKKLKLIFIEVNTNISSNFLKN